MIVYPYLNGKLGYPANNIWSNCYILIEHCGNFLIKSLQLDFETQKQILRSHNKWSFRLMFENSIIMHFGLSPQKLPFLKRGFLCQFFYFNMTSILLALWSFFPLWSESRLEGQIDAKLYDYGLLKTVLEKCIHLPWCIVFCAPFFAPKWIVSLCSSSVICIIWYLELCAPPFTEMINGASSSLILRVDVGVSKCSTWWKYRYVRIKK